MWGALSNLGKVIGYVANNSGQVSSSNPKPTIRAEFRRSMCILHTNRKVPSAAQELLNWCDQLEWRRYANVTRLFERMGLNVGVFISSNNLRHHASADGLAAFADYEPQVFVRAMESMFTCGLLRPNFSIATMSGIPRFRRGAV